MSEMQARASVGAKGKGAARARLSARAIDKLRARARAKKDRKPEVGKQLVLRRTAGHGGKRAGAGRKKKTNGRRNVPHLTRPRLGKRTPVHVTMRMKSGRASLRAEVMRNMFACIVEQTRCEQFHVAMYSLQHDHVHLICEPEDRAALSSGIRRIAIRFSLRMNALFGRTKGKNWGDRYHRHDLRTPREVRNALAYVLLNGKKHGACRREASFIDPFSSAGENDVWTDLRIADGAPRACEAPRFWLLGVGWREHGGAIRSTDAPVGEGRATLSRDGHGRRK